VGKNLALILAFNLLMVILFIILLILKISYMLLTQSLVVKKYKN